MEHVRAVQTAPLRPALSELIGWLSLGAVVGLVLMIFQPPLAIALAVGLPAVGAVRAWRSPDEGVPRNAWTLGAFGLGLLILDVVLLAPLAF